MVIFSLNNKNKYIKGLYRLCHSVEAGHITPLSMNDAVGFCGWNI
jgi:hypothetical protein